MQDEVGSTIIFMLVHTCLTEALLNIILMQCTRVYFEEMSQHNNTQSCYMHMYSSMTDTSAAATLQCSLCDATQ